MPEPMVVQIMRANKEAILAQEDGKMQEMAARWLRIEQSLKDKVEALALEASRIVEDGGVLNRALAVRMERMQTLLYQVRAETGQYVQWADGFITDYQADMAALGLGHASDAISAVLSEHDIRAAFNRLNVDAVNNMIGLAGDGSPLSYYLRDIHGSAADGILDALLNGVAQGVHPTKIAQDMMDGLGIGLQQAMNTARTETLRAYRAASLAQYEQSGLVRGYKRISARDERVCAGCLFTDGQVYEDLSQFDEHNQGRCAAVPLLIGLEDANWQSPTDWFEGQGETVQESILGTGRFEAWKNGALLTDMVTRVVDPTWGGAFVPTPVGELASGQ